MVLINVNTNNRTEEEFRKGHVEDSLNVPYLFFTSSGKALKISLNCTFYTRTPYL
jgi:hypothetical protein